MLKTSSGTTTTVTAKLGSHKQYLNSKPPVRKYHHKVSYQTAGNASRISSGHHESQQIPSLAKVSVIGGRLKFFKRQWLKLTPDNEVFQGIWIWI